MLTLIKKIIPTSPNWDRPALDGKPDNELLSVRCELENRLEKLEQERARNELYRSIMKQRTGRILVDSFLMVRLSARLERLFEAIRSGSAEAWPVDEALAVFDGVVARMLAKRVTMLVVAVFTIVPAVGSLILLAEQNWHMIEQNRVEEVYSFETIRKSLLEVINGTSQQFVSDNESEGAQRIEALPSYHRRIRTEAFGTYISFEKQRWSKAEKFALPPTRYVDMRGCNLSHLTLGGGLGLIEGESREDMSRVYLAKADLTGSKFLRSHLTGTVLRDAKATGLYLSSPDASFCDFSGMDAEGSQFVFDAKTSTPLDLSHAIFDGAHLEHSFFDQAILIQCSFNGSHLSGVTFSAGIVGDCNLTQAELGEGVRFVETPVHKTLVRQDQQARIEIPEFCYYETTEVDGVVRIMTDKAKYDAWWIHNKAKLDAAAEAELKEVEEKRRALEAAGER